MCVCDPHTSEHELLTIGLGIGGHGTGERRKEKRETAMNVNARGISIVGGILFYARRKNSRVVRARIVEFRASLERMRERLAGCRCRVIR